MGLSDHAFLVGTLARRGLLTPGSPVRVAKQLAELQRWGFGLTGELRQAAARDPGQVAVIDDNGATTYGALLARAERLSHALAIREGDRIGLLCRNSASMIETLVAVTLAGGDPVLLNTGLAKAQLVTVAADQKLTRIIHAAEFDPGAAAESVSENDLDALIAATAPGRSRPPARPGRTIVLTSGTTGVPKGARRPTPTGFGPLASIIDRIPLHAGTRLMIAAPLFHTWGFAGLQIALALRATIVLRRRFEPAAAAQTLIDQRCDALIAVPVMLQGLAELPGSAPLPRLSVVAASGSAMPGGLATRFMDRFGDVLYNLYGSTEASWASIATPADLRAAPGTAGRPPHGTRVAVLDPDGRPVQAGESGRIFVGNEMLFEGYTNGTAVQVRDGLLATGDVGHLDAAGRLYVDGREDDMIVSGGENVFPSEVENLLADLSEIREVAVIGVPDDTYGQRLAAYVVLRPGSRISAEAIKEHVRRNRARFCVPRDVTFLEALPRTTTGKVVTRELRAGP